jgi:hypothetical protein
MEKDARKIIEEWLDSADNGGDISMSAGEMMHEASEAMGPKENMCATCRYHDGMRCNEGSLANMMKSEIEGRAKKSKWTEESRLKALCGLGLTGLLFWCVKHEIHDGCSASFDSQKRKQTSFGDDVTPDDIGFISRFRHTPIYEIPLPDPFPSMGFPSWVEDTV